MYKDEKNISVLKEVVQKIDVGELTVQCGVFALVGQCGKCSGNPGKMDSSIPLKRHH